MKRNLRILLTLWVILIIIGQPVFSQEYLRSSIWDQKAELAFQYCKENGLNTDQCVLIDMSIHSGKNRLVVYDFNEKRILNTGICSHGSCDGGGRSGSYETAIFSNTPESYCSSKGKYKIGKRGYSNYGIHINYKLHGLEQTNNNAFQRIIVLHSWSEVSDSEVYPEFAPNSLGCPMVSNTMMKKLDELLKNKNTPMLLWIYD